MSIPAALRIKLRRVCGRTELHSPLIRRCRTGSDADWRTVDNEEERGPSGCRTINASTLYRIFYAVSINPIKFLVLDRATLVFWVCRAAWWLKLLYEWLLLYVRFQDRVFCNETPLPRLDPGRGRTKIGPSAFPVHKR